MPYLDCLKWVYTGLILMSVQLGNIAFTLFSFKILLTHQMVRKPNLIGNNTGSISNKCLRTNVIYNRLWRTAAPARNPFSSHFPSTSTCSISHSPLSVREPYYNFHSNKVNMLWVMGESVGLSIARALCTSTFPGQRGSGDYKSNCTPIALHQLILPCVLLQAISPQSVGGFTLPV